MNTDACTGCKRCITSIGCPAINFNTNANGPRSRGRGLAVIDTSLCVGCNLCVQVCPFKAIIPGEVAAELENPPAWPPYGNATMSGQGDGNADMSGDGPITGIRTFADTTATVEAIASESPAKSGPFRPFPSFENPWDTDDTDMLPAMTLADEPEAEPQQGLEPEPQWESLAEPESAIVPTPTEPEPALDLQLDFGLDENDGPDDVKTGSPALPDFGIAAEFEEELRADEEL